MLVKHPKWHRAHLLRHLPAGNLHPPKTPYWAGMACRFDGRIARRGVGRGNGTTTLSGTDQRVNRKRKAAPAGAAGPPRRPAAGRKVKAVPTGANGKATSRAPQ